jgi:hypothetical protein
MKTESASTHVDNDNEDTNRHQNFISRTVTKLALNCALACLSVRALYTDRDKTSGHE